MRPADRTPRVRSHCSFELDKLSKKRTVMRPLVEAAMSGKNLRGAYEVYVIIYSSDRSVRQEDVGGDDRLAILEEAIAENIRDVYIRYVKCAYWYAADKEDHVEVMVKPYGGAIPM